MSEPLECSKCIEYMNSREYQSKAASCDNINEIVQVLEQVRMMHEKHE